MLADFRANHPGVEVHIRHAAGGSREMALNVREGRLDLAFVAVPGADLPGIKLTPLIREPIVLVAAATHPLAQRKTVALSDLSTQTTAEFPDGWGVRIANDRAFAAARLTRTITYEVNDTASLVGFVRHGLAVAAMPPTLVDARDGLVLIPIRDHRTEFVTTIATPSNRRLSAAARALLETIKERAIPLPSATTTRRPDR
jgi:DNA-binding transcriptional LysR family regulator